jgi:hypothetical protein
MFEAALAFERYRFEVVRSWPDSVVNSKLLARRLSVHFEGSIGAQKPLVGGQALENRR